MKPFAYHRPTALAEAAALLAATPGAVAISGGMSLLPAMKLRLAEHAALIDLTRIEALHCIAVTPEAVTIGAATRHADVAFSPEIRRAIPALAALAGGIGDPHVRNRGTLGGALANADPAADYPAAALALGASIRTERRTLAADSFFQGLFTTALAPGEIITDVRFPRPIAAAYAKFRSPASRFAIVGVFVARFASHVRVAVTGAAARPFRVPAMEEALARSFTAQAIAGIGVPAEGLNDDIHAEPSYRAHLVGVMARRAVASA
jgi:aerobic carbon-monoxide dehydrogenase medium subunit